MFVGMQLYLHAAAGRRGLITSVQMFTHSARSTVGDAEGSKLLSATEDHVLTLMGCMAAVSICSPICAPVVISGSSSHHCVLTRCAY